MKLNESQSDKVKTNEKATKRHVSTFFLPRIDYKSTEKTRWY